MDPNSSSSKDALLEEACKKYAEATRLCPTLYDVSLSFDTLFDQKNSSLQYFQCFWPWQKQRKILKESQFSVSL